MEIMEQISLDDLEAGVDRLLAAFERVKSENRQLKEQVAAMEKRQDLFKDRLDAMLAKLEGLDLP
jgi:predicted nuclease with TOPRIM domain